MFPDDVVHQRQRDLGQPRPARLLLDDHFRPAFEVDEQDDDRLGRVMDLEFLLAVLVFFPGLVFLGEDGFAQRFAVDRAEASQWSIDIHKNSVAYSSARICSDSDSI